MPGFDYRGRISVFVNVCTHDRHPAFAEADVASTVGSLLVNVARKGDVELTAYCLMPDHGHLLLTGLSEESHIPTVVGRWKQFSGHWYSTTKKRRLWQADYWDYVVRDRDQLFGIAKYIVTNPIRAGLASTLTEWPSIGSDRWTREDLCELATTQEAPFWWPD